MKKAIKKVITFLIAICMLTSNFGGLNLVVFARREPVVLKQELKASDDRTYEITVSYEIELEEDEEPPEPPELVVRELLAPVPEPDEAAEETDEQTPAGTDEAPAEAAPVNDGPTDAELSAPLGTGLPAESAAPAEDEALAEDAEPEEADALVGPSAEDEAPAEDAEPAESAEADAEETPAETPAEQPEEGYEYTYNEYVQKAANALECTIWDVNNVRVFDISLHDPVTGEEFQPESSVKVSIRLLRSSFSEDGDVGVVHFGDKPEVMSSAVNEKADTVEFETDGFSVYVVVDHEGGEIITPRVEFHYLSETYSEVAGKPGQYVAGPFKFRNRGEAPDNWQTSQIVTDGQALSLISNPPNITRNGKSMYFFGWYIVNPVSVAADGSVTYTWEADPEQVPNEQTIEIPEASINWANDEHTAVNSIDWTMNGVTHTASSASNKDTETEKLTVLDKTGCVHVYLAPIYEDYYFVNFHIGAKESELWNSLLVRRLVVLGNDNQAVVRIGSITAPSEDAAKKVFAGWETVTTTQVQKTELVNEVETPVWLVNGEEEAADVCPAGGEAVMITVPAATKTQFKTIDDSDDPDTRGTELNGTVLAADASAYTPAQTEDGYYIVVQQQPEDGGIKDFTGNSLDLYPVFAEARWINYNVGSNLGATYVPSEYLLTSDMGDHTLSKLPGKTAARRNGYTFNGWYLGAVMDNTGTILNLNGPYDQPVYDKNGNPEYEDDGVTPKTIHHEQAVRFTDENGNIVNGPLSQYDGEDLLYKVENGRLYFYAAMSDALILTARWDVVLNTSYSVVIWQQKVSDHKGAADEDKTYDFLESHQIVSASNRTLEQILASSDLNSYISTAVNGKYAGFTYRGATMSSATVSGDGTTVVNLYYDRNLLTIDFDRNVPVYTYTETNDTTGQLYGWVDGVYVPVTFVSSTSEDVTVYSFRYTYAQTSSTTQGITYYGIVGGRYVPLEREQGTVTRYTPQYTYLGTTSNSGTQYGLVGSEYVELSRDTSWDWGWVYSYTYDTYTPTTSNRGTQYGSSDGVNFFQIYYKRNNWRLTNNNNGTVYNGTRYVRTENDYTGQRYTRSDNYAVNSSITESDVRTRSVSAGAYSYTVPADPTTGNNLYYKDANGGWVHVTATSTTSVVYKYNGQIVDPHYARSDGGDDYDGQRTTEEGVVYGTDDRGALVELDSRQETIVTKHWKYEDDNGEEQSYTGKVYRRTETTASSFTGLYGQTLEQNGYTWPSNYRWTSSTGSGLTFLDAFIFDGLTYATNNKTRISLSSNTTQTGGNVYFYKQNLDGSWPETATNTVSTSGNSTFTITDKYNGFTAYQYKQGANGTWQTLGTPNANNEYASGLGISNGLYIRFSRNDQTFTFVVNYPNRADLEFTIAGSRSEDREETRKYEAPLAEFKNAYTPNAPDHYTFAGWYEDETCTVPFNFDSSLNANKRVFAKWEAEEFLVTLDPNGAEIDHIDHTGGSYNSSVSVFAPGSTYDTSKSTYFTPGYGETVGYYELQREYVELSDAAAQLLPASQVYYYVNVQFNAETDGEDGVPGLPADLRNALFLTADQIHDYYEYYRTALAYFQQQKPKYQTLQILDEGPWRDLYVSAQKYRRVQGNESYTFLGWYEVDENGVPLSNMTYDNSTPVTSNIRLKAFWRLDGGYRILYIPQYDVPPEDGTGDPVPVNGEMIAWSDPEIMTATYANDAATNIYKQPTGITANGQPTEEYVFTGWRLVSVSYDANNNPVYTPLATDKVFYDPGDPFTVRAAYADAQGIIRFQAMYERVDASTRRPLVSDLTLDANTGYLVDESGNELTANVSLTSAWGGVGRVVMDKPSNQILFSDLQTDANVPLYRFSTTLTQDLQGNTLTPAGINYFMHAGKFFLLGFDDGPDEGDYVAKYPADSLVAVDRVQTDDNTIYAVWEPMVYLNIKNDTHKGDVSFMLSATDNEALQVLNLKDGLYGRIPKDADTTVFTVKDGETLSLAVPYGEGRSIIIRGQNELGVGWLLSANSKLGETERALTGTLTGEAADYVDVQNKKSFGFSDTLVVDETGVTVTFTAQKNPYTLELQDNHNGNGTGGPSQEVYFSVDGDDNIYYRTAGTTSYTLTTPSTRIGYEFVGWDRDPEWAKKHDVETEHPAYYAEHMDIDVLKTFFGDEDVVTLYAVWKVNADSHIVYVYKDVPEPGDQTKPFTFTVKFEGRYSYTPYYYNTYGGITEGTASTNNPISIADSFTLKHGEYLRITSKIFLGDNDENSATYNTKSNVTLEVQHFDVDGNELEARSLKWTWSDWNTTYTQSGRTYHRGRTIYLTQQNFTVTEESYLADKYETSSEVTGNYSVDHPLAASGSIVSWNNADAGGTAIVTNTRQTADVFVTKTLEGPVTSGNFPYTASYTLDGKTKDLGSFEVFTGVGHTLEKIPVGAVLTITETAANIANYEVEASSETGITDSDASDAVFQFTVPYRTTEQGAIPVSFKNTLKSYPVKILVRGYDGTDYFDDVSAMFSLTQPPASSIFTSRASSTANHGVIYETGKAFVGTTPDKKLYIGDYSLTEIRVYNNYKGLSESVPITVDKDGVSVPAGTLNVTCAKDASGVYVITVTNRKTVTITVSKTLVDPIYTGIYSYNFTASYLQDGKTVSESFSVENGKSNSFTMPAGLPLTVTENLGTTDAMAYRTTISVDGTEIPIGANETQTTYTNSNPTADIELGFTNTRKTVTVTVRKLVEDTTDTNLFHFTARVHVNTRGIANSTIYDGGTPGNTSDDIITGTDGWVNLPDFKRNDELTLRIPVGAGLTVVETGAQTALGETVDDMDSIYGTTMEAVLMDATPHVYTTGVTTDEDTRTFTVAKAPDEPLRVTFNNGPAGVDVMFRKVDGFGDALAGAQFSLYNEYGCTTLVQVRVNDAKVDYAESKAAFETAENGTEYNVLFKAPTGVWYMREENTVTGFDHNYSIYRVVVGKAGSTVQGIQLPADRGYLIQRMSSSTAVENPPDIAAYGIMNISSATRRVIIRKVDGSYAPLTGVKFDLLRWDRTPVVTGVTSGDAGCIWSGALAYGTYYLHETEKGGNPVNLWYTVTVSYDGTICSAQSMTVPPAP